MFFKIVVFKNFLNKVVGPQNYFINTLPTDDKKTRHVETL